MRILKVIKLFSYDTVYEFDFVFSFAGEDRDIVEHIKNLLKEQNYSVFYDNDFQHELVGKDLYSYLRKIYKDKGKYVVCFISENYTKKIWTNLEFTAIKERLMSTFFSSDFLIPIIIDDSNIMEDIPSFFGFYKHISVESTSKLLMDKFESTLIEDNYLNNIDNFINFLSEQLASVINKRGFKVNIENNTMVICKKSFKFVPDRNINIPCILVYFMDEIVPSIFISWKRENTLRFNVHYFYDIKTSLTEQSLNNILKILEDYIMEIIG